MIKNFIIFVLILGIIILLSIAYFNPTILFENATKTKEALKNPNYSKRESLMSSLDFYSSSNIISLLSIKYSISPDILIEILSEYNNQTQLDYDFDNFNLTEIKNKMKNDVNNLNNNLNNISSEYNIKLTTLVNILIDYKLLKNINK
jgi:hypothetical protein